MSQVNEVEQVKLHEIDLGAIELTIRLIKERNELIHFFNKNKSIDTGVLPVKTQIQWYNEQIKKVL